MIKVMNSQNVLKAAAVAGLLLMGLGCATDRRVLTTAKWMSLGDPKDSTKQVSYIGYWEGSCRPIMGCGTGMARLKACTVESDNSLKCEDQSEIERLLNQ